MLSLVFNALDVFMDESGDLGFSPSSSRHFAVVALATDAPYRLARLVRRAHRRYGADVKGGAEFKFNKSGDGVRRYFLKGLSETNTRVFWIGFAKRAVPPETRTRKEFLRTGGVACLLGEVSQRVHTRSFRVTIDRFAAKPDVRLSLYPRLEDVLEEHHSGYFAPSLVLRFADSRESEELQVTDFAAGAVFQLLERGNDQCYRMISDIVEAGIALL